MGWGLSVKVVINTTEFPITSQHPASPPSPFHTCLMGGVPPLVTHLSDGWSTAWHSLSHRLLMWSSFSLRVRASFLLDCWITSPPSAFMLFRMFWWLLIPELKSYNIMSVINDHLLDSSIQILQHNISYKQSFTWSQNTNPVINDYLLYPRTQILQHNISYKRLFTWSQNSNPTTLYQLWTLIHCIIELESYNMVSVIINHQSLSNKQTPEIIRNTRKKQSLNETRLHAMAIL